MATDMHSIPDIVLTSAQSSEALSERSSAPEVYAQRSNASGSCSAESQDLPGRAQLQRNGAAKRDPIARPKLADLVQSRLLAVIQAENLRPGDFLPSERELMQSYAVGRPSVREAMQNLQRMGLIEINHGERPRMATPSFERMVSSMTETMRHVLVNSATTLDHLKEARATFEMTMAQIAARKRTPGDIDDLYAILADQERAVWIRARFCERMAGFITASQSSLATQSSRVSARRCLLGLSSSTSILSANPAWSSFTLTEHRQILGAIERAEPDKAARLTADHLNRANALYNQANCRSSIRLRAVEAMRVSCVLVY